MGKTELVAPKRAAIEAEVHSQQVYWAIGRGLLAVRHKDGRAFVTRESLERWKANLLERRRMRSEERQVIEEARVQA